MSNLSGTHYNSGCESGWTGYFEESLESEAERFGRSVVDYGGGEEEEGDLSMVSDASSGPRNGFGDGQMGFSFEENCQSLRRNGAISAAKSKRKEEMGRRNQHSCLDDTASSPVFGLSKRETNHPYINEGFVENVKEFSQNHSRKQHGNGKKQTSFFQSSSAKKSTKNVSGDFQEAKWE